jgi:hypothetical protein
MSAPQNNLSGWIIGHEHRPIRAISPGTEFPTRTPDWLRSSKPKLRVIRRYGRRSRPSWKEEF